MKHGSLFTGAGGLDSAVEQLFGSELAWTSDIKPASVKLIEHYWPGTNLGDITQIDWDQVEPVDIITGGFPCTDISLAGKQAGLIRYGDDKTRSGLWSEMCRAINTLRPSLVVAENVRALTSVKADSNVEPCPWCVGDPAPEDVLRALGAVLGDLADIGYDAAWCGLRAADVGAPHGRFRIFILAWPAAYSSSDEPERRGGRRDVGSAAAPDEGTGGQRQRVRNATVNRSAAAANTVSSGRNRRAPEPIGSSIGGTAAAGSGAGDRLAANTGSQRFRELTGGAPAEEAGPSAGHVPGDHHGERPAADWGPYAPAVERWADLLGRPAPHPTVTGPKGGQALSPDLTDWMMGWPDGWTDIPGLSRAQRLSLGGDGVVPQQAMAALQWLLQQVPQAVAS